MWFHKSDSDRLENVEYQLDMVIKQLRKLMALVQVNSDDLDALDTALDEVATAIEAKIEALAVALPDADLSALQEDVAALRAISAPAATE